MTDDDREKYPSELAERFQVRLPPGLRDRIKAYADRHGRSMNAEIVRVLEREYPEPWPAETRFREIIDMIAVLKKGEASDQYVEKLFAELKDTIEGIITGRVRGIDKDARAKIADMYRYMRERYQEEEQEHFGLDHFDDEEFDAFEFTGELQKFSDPIDPNKK